jgi:hypothetical protein
MFFNFLVSYDVTKVTGGSTLKQNTVIRVSRLFILCISFVFGGKYVEFRIIFSLQYSISTSYTTLTILVRTKQSV